MKIEQIVRRHFIVTFNEEEARRIRVFLEALQERDMGDPCTRAQIDPEEIPLTIADLEKLAETLRPDPAAHSTDDTRHL